MMSMTTPRTFTLVNLKPGTGKTTSAVWLAHAMHELGLGVLLVDGDPAASALHWSSLAQFPFQVIGMPMRDAHRRLPDVAGRLGVDVVVVDSPQVEDHQGVAASLARAATDVLIPVAPTPIELERMAPIGTMLDDLDALRSEPARRLVVLNRVVTGAASGADARALLGEVGYPVARTTIGRRELYAQSFGRPVRTAGTEWAVLVEELASAVPA